MLVRQFARTFWLAIVLTGLAVAQNVGAPVYVTNPSTIGMPVYVSNAVTNNAFENTICGLPDVTHCWKMHAATSAGGATPGPCLTTAGAFADTPTGTAAPSPVPLVVVISSGSPPITCQDSDLLPNNGNLGSVTFCYAGGGTNVGCPGLTTGQLHNSYLQIDKSVDPSPPFTQFCLVRPALIAVQENDFWNREQSLNLKAYFTTSGLLSMIINSGVHNNAGYAPTKIFEVLTVSNTATTLYQNGVPMALPTTTPPAPVPTSGTFGATLDGTSKDFSGSMEDCGYANDVWALAKVQYLNSLTGW